MNFVKVSKTDVNLLLKYIHEDNPVYALILSLVYIYGRSIGDILKLKYSDIDVKHNTIDFYLSMGSISFMIHPDIKKDLLDFIEDNDGEYLFFDDCDVSLSKVNQYSNKVNKYLRNCIHSINCDEGLYWSYPSLVCSDFRRLRGQHLFLDGADIKTINALFQSSSLQSLKHFLGYDTLIGLRFPCRNIDSIFHNFTDLGIYNDGDVDEFVFAFECLEFGIGYISVDFSDNSFSILDFESEGIVSIINSLVDDVFIEGLFLFNVGDYKFFDDVKVSRV